MRNNDEDAKCLRVTRDLRWRALAQWMSCVSDVV